MNSNCLVDFHMHTEYSPDSDASMASICNAAVVAGLQRIAITDHVEIPALFADGYDRTAALSFAQAGGMQLLFKNKLQIERGIELGEPLHDLEKAEQFLASHKFDFVLGSLHNLKNDTDFYHYDFTNVEIRPLMNRYFDEVLDMVRWGKFHSLAHLTYPFRYFPDQSYAADYSPWQDSIDSIFRTLAQKGIALEINTSGLRQPMQKTLPDLPLICRFRELGGEMVTVGSDAHFPKDVGSNIIDGIQIAKQAGFRHIAVFHRGKLEKLPIE
ncbi:MAG TPA: histidinol phosphate phosphatase [Ruminococcaceae bacterium]|nr:histidinol phosphate phosphatase [Oscillospiraceae bacterium]